MKELVIDLTLPVGDPKREILREMAPQDEATHRAHQAQAATKATAEEAAKASRHEAAAVIKAKAATDPAFAALVTVLGL